MPIGPPCRSGWRTCRPREGCRHLLRSRRLRRSRGRRHGPPAAVALPAGVAHHGCHPPAWDGVHGVWRRRERHPRIAVPGSIHPVRSHRPNELRTLVVQCLSAVGLFIVPACRDGVDQGEGSARDVDRVVAGVSALFDRVRLSRSHPQLLPVASSPLVAVSIAAFLHQFPKGHELVASPEVGGRVCSWPRSPSCACSLWVPLLRRPVSAAPRGQGQEGPDLGATSPRSCRRAMIIPPQSSG